MSKTIKLRKVICNLKEDFKATEELIYNRTSKGVTIMSAKNAGTSRLQNDLRNLKRKMMSVEKDKKSLIRPSLKRLIQ